MTTLDPRLRYLMQTADTASPATVAQLGLEDAIAPTPTVEVLVRMRHEAAWQEAGAMLAAAGLRVRAAVPGPYLVASGDIDLAQLPALEQVASVRRVEASRPLVPELDLCVPEVRADLVHAGNPAVRGVGTLVGIIDSGIDFRHPDFRRPDGTTRIRLLWDQGAQSVPGGRVHYGREYTQAQIDAALDGTGALADAPPIDPDGHGTHVTGIAAGGGRAKPTHLGLAPDAELIIVVLNAGDAATLGRSVRAFEAFTYVVEQAAGMPVAINFSQGMNGGGHAGETVLETGLDNLARRPNVAIIKSAGNEQQERIHAGGTLPAQATRELALDVRSNDRLDDIIEVWFNDTDDIAVALRPPGGTATPFVPRGTDGAFTTAAGNSVSIAVDADAEQTGDTVATLILARGTASMIQPGQWTLLLRAGNLSVGRFDAWIERTHRSFGGGEQSRFAETASEPISTISVPGTARNIITVGAYVTRLSNPPAAPLGAVSLFSSNGPTRYGQLKPELVAPGEVTESAAVGTSGLVTMRGTSMAAPVVTGAAALLLSQRAGLTCMQLKQILTRTARRTGAAIAAPDNAWGYGKLDVAAAVDLARQVRFPVITNVLVAGASISWETDVETTGAVRFLPSRRQLLLSKNPRSLADLTPARSHSITLSGVPAGTYFCQIVAFTQDNFWTEEDDGGRCFAVNTFGNAAPDVVADSKTLAENPTPTLVG